MATINNPADVIRACAETSSRGEKISILRQYDSDKLRFICLNAVSPYEVFHVKQYEFGESLQHDDFSYEKGWKALKFCIHHLRSRDIADIRGFIKATSVELNEDQQQALRWMLDKDLCAGISVKTVNKAFPGLIPEFAIQKAIPMDLTRVVYPCFAETKFDGERNIAIVTGSEVMHLSSNGKEKKNYNYYNEELLAIAAGNDLVFDGEIVGISGDSKAQRRAVQQQAQRKYDVDMSGCMFVVWDMLPLGTWKLKQGSRALRIRRAELRANINQFRDTTDVQNFKIKLAKAKVCKTEEELLTFYNKAIMSRKEGAIAKNPEASYNFKRDDTWIKLKPSETSDFPVIDIIEGKKGRKGTLGSVVVDVEGVNVHCGIGPGMTIDECRELWQDPEILIGKTAEIKYSRITLDGSLLAGKLIRIREDK